MWSPSNMSGLLPKIGKKQDQHNTACWFDWSWTGTKSDVEDWSLSLRRCKRVDSGPMLIVRDVGELADIGTTDQNTGVSF
jgi:hypothetical protein